MELLRTSASQVKDFRSCRRLWFYKTVLKQYQPPTEALQKGSTIHGALEAYLKAGSIAPEITKQAEALGLTAADLAEFVKAIEPFVGTPGEGVTEHRDEMPTYEGGPTWALVVDHAREVMVQGHEIPQIDDLKTTSDFRYVKTPEQIAVDVQMVSYAKWALRLYEDSQKPPPEFVSLRHVYVRTRGKRVGTKTDVLVTPMHVEEHWTAVLDDVRTMVDLARAAPDPQEIPPSTDHCSAYGGCYLRPKCFGSISVAGLLTLEKNNMPNSVPPSSAKPRLADRMKALSGTSASAPSLAIVPSPTPPPPVPAQPSSPALSPTQSPTPPLTPPQPELKCGDRCVLAPDALCTLEPHTGDHESRSDRGGVIHWTDAHAIRLGPSENWKPLSAAPAPTSAPQVLPPDAPSRESSAADVAAANAPRKRARRSAPAATSVQAPVTAPAAAPAQATVPAQAPAPTPVTAPATAPASAPTAPTPAAVVCPLLDLYVDCYPVKGDGDPPTLAEGIIAECAAETATAAQVPDYRFASFSAAKGGFAAAVRKRLSSMPKVLVITSSTHGAAELFEILAPFARRVVRGVRG